MPEHATTTAATTAAPTAAPPATSRGSARTSTNGRASASCRVAVVANPFSGTGPNRRRVERLLATLREKGLDPHVCWTPAQRRAAFEESGDFRCAVVAGGDGSIADAINELDRVGRLVHTPLATLPMGNENLFADAMGFGKHPGPLADAIASAASRPIDLGSAGGRLFTLMVSAGLDAEVVRRMDRWRSRTHQTSPTPGPTAATAARDAEPSSSAPTLRRVNRASYAVRTLAALRAYRYPPLRLETDDAEITGSHAFVFNIARYGGGLHIAPDARPDDGLLDYVVFQKPGALRLVGYALDVLRGKHRDREDVITGRAAKIRVRSDTGVPVQADGDAADHTPLEIVARPAAARVLLMPGSQNA